MDKGKAKKAVKKSTVHKKQSEALAADQALAMQMQTGLLDPEVQAAQVDLQPADGYVNPYHAMGQMAPISYAPGNMLGGYNYPVFVNPEA